ncbi:unnamed protein product [Polarella glacialis]|uniref:Uncharacterized protein n=1 Tax=Polarella glacialis TaxID=89957 RepID=A0A813JSG8_POLGL|nr:unnamed protein product [Polarella glacialis]
MWPLFGGADCSSPFMGSAVRDAGAEGDMLRWARPKVLPAPPWQRTANGNNSNNSNNNEQPLPQMTPPLPSLSELSAFVSPREAPASDQPPWRRREERRSAGNRPGQEASELQQQQQQQQLQQQQQQQQSAAAPPAAAPTRPTGRSITESREDAPQSKPANNEGSKGPGGIDLSEDYKVGDKVRYWSATHNKWVDACVHKIHRGPDGKIIKCDLSAKSKADISQVRNASTPEDAPAPLSGAQQPALVPPAPVLVPPVATPPLAAKASSSALPSQRNEAETPVPSKAMSSDVGLAAGRQMVSEFQVGDEVQYFSEGTHNWVKTIVEARRTQNGLVTYDLTCKKAAPCDRVREAVVEYKVGEAVEYWSSSSGRWIAAEMLSLKSDSKTCDLNVKPAAPLSKVRKASASENAEVSGAFSSRCDPKVEEQRSSNQRASAGGTGHAAGTTNNIKNNNNNNNSNNNNNNSNNNNNNNSNSSNNNAPPPPLACGFKAGDQVQYYSDTKGVWIEAVVVKVVDQDGCICYDLSCKKAAQADKVRPSLVASKERYQVGNDVEYWSTSAGRWVAAKVQSLRLAMGQLDLDIKLHAPLGRIRHPVTSSQQLPVQHKDLPKHQQLPQASASSLSQRPADSDRDYDPFQDPSKEEADASQRQAGQPSPRRQSHEESRGRVRKPRSRSRRRQEGGHRGLEDKDNDQDRRRHAKESSQLAHIPSGNGRSELGLDPLKLEQALRLQQQELPSQGQGRTGIPRGATAKSAPGAPPRAVYEPRADPAGAADAATSTAANSSSRGADLSALEDPETDPVWQALAKEQAEAMAQQSSRAESHGERPRYHSLPRNHSGSRGRGRRSRSRGRRSRSRGGRGRRH